MDVPLLKKCFLLKVQSDILMSMNNQEITLLVLLDLTAAFDTINHKILLNVLENNFGIIGSAHDWFASYLSDQKQSVQINNWSSDDFNLSCGVLQGSCFSSVLFILYISRLNQVIFLYSSNVGDNDTTTESCLKTFVNYEIKEFSDINHSTRTLGVKVVCT